MLKKIAGTLSLLMLFFSLCGCAALKLRPYQAPLQGPIAYLSVVDSKGNPPSLDLMIALFDEQNNCKGRSFIHGINDQPQLYKNFIKIKANEPISLAAYYMHQVGAERVNENETPNKLI